MALWGSRRKEVIDPAVAREQQRRERLWARIEVGLAEDPCFDVRTFDGVQWIDPFTGQGVPAPFDGHDVRLEVLSDEGHCHWQNARLRSIEDLRTEVWRIYLTEQAPEDQRLRLVGPDGCWYNPFSGAFLDDIRPQDPPSAADLRAIAQNLALDPNNHPHSLPDLQNIRTRVPELSDNDDSGLHEVSISDEDFQIGTRRETHAEARSGTSRMDRERVDPLQRPSSRVVVPPSASPSSLPVASVLSAMEALDALTAYDTPPRQFQPAMPASVPLAKPAAQVAAPTQVATPLPAQATPGRQISDHDDDMAKAARIQQQLLGTPPAIAGLDIALAYRPMSQVGGDFYDFIELDEERLFFVVGDVAGHGIQAALLVQSFIKTLRFVCRYAGVRELVDILAAVNDAVREDLLKGQFITCFAGIIERHDGACSLVSACCGHHPIICANTKGPVLLRQIGAQGMAIGLSSGSIMRSALKTQRHELDQGDVLIVYTDGICEAMSPDGEEFGHWRSAAAAIAHLDADVQSQVDGVVGYVEAFTGGESQDDITVLAIRILD
jgi:hypothetical protein